MDNILNVKSETVWNKEVYEGFQSLLKSIYGETFNVLVRKPDEDFKLEKFPCAVLQIPTFKFSVDRWWKLDRYTLGLTEEGWVTDAYPLPFDLQLQMDFYAKLQSDMDTLQIKWLSHFGRDLMLQVINRGGERDEVLVLPDGGARRLDEVTGKERLLRLVQNFTVFAKIEEHDTRKIIKVPDKIKIITFLLKGEGRNEIPVDKHIGATPDVYAIRRKGKPYDLTVVRR